MYSLRHTRHSHTGTEPRYVVQLHRSTATQRYMLQASCVSTLNGRSVWCRQTGLVAANVFKPAANMVALTELSSFATIVLAPSSATYTFKMGGSDIPFWKKIKIAEYPFKTDRRLNKEAKIHALGVLIIDRLFRSLW